MKFKAKWIWKRQSNYNQYNQTVIATKSFHLKSLKSADIIITADSYYRLFINGCWVNDGPSRSWTTHFQYDIIDILPFIRQGNNEVKIIAKYYGVGGTQRSVEQAGLLAEISVDLANGTKQVISTDKTWHITEAKQFVSNTPRNCVQMEAFELYDARLEKNGRYSAAVELYQADEGPWGNLSPRSTKYLTKEDYNFSKFYSSAIIDKGDNTKIFCLPSVRILYPGLIEANCNVSTPCAMACIIRVSKETKVSVEASWLDFSIDGKKSKTGNFNLSRGNHLLLAVSDSFFDHHGKDKTISITGEKLKLINPLNSNFENVWSFIYYPQLLFSKDDYCFRDFYNDDEHINSLINRFSVAVKQLFKNVYNSQTLKEYADAEIVNIPSETMLCSDPHIEFMMRKKVKSKTAAVENPYALLFDNPEHTIIKPSKDGNIELVYDLGEQNCGYYDFELIANEGVCIDIFGVEYISPNGKIQHTPNYRNGLRYITKKGLNRYTSLKRRSARYVFITIKNLTSEIKIRNIKLIESTYPVERRGSFNCNDQRLDKIWEISSRTLKLCMEDTFTDCPLYEQTLWVGDARNESLFAYSVFGAEDLAYRCIEIAAQSLEKLPIVGAQVPSTWDFLLPAWSFLWQISVWEYYWQTGDKQALRRLWQALMKNLKGAQALLDDNGLISGTFWNMFDWTGADQVQKTVLHNSMFLVGAIEATEKIAEVLDKTKNLPMLKRFKSKLKKNINKYWLDDKKAYPDSIYDDGKLSPSICQHTSFLAYLYDIVEKKNVDLVIQNAVSPPEDMVKVGSPFAAFYLYEMFEKAGFEDKIIESIYENYLPMLDLQASTVWETYPTGTLATNDFPTRSHCHGWSCSPLYYFGRIILGVRQISAGGKSFEISPMPNGLSWAKGSIATFKGDIRVDWRIENNSFIIYITAPKGIVIKFNKNNFLKDYTIVKTIKFISEKTNG